MIENVLLWFAFMVVLLVVNLYCLKIHFRLVHLVTICIILLTVTAMWSDFAGFEVIALSMVLLNGVVCVMGMFR